MVNAAIADGGFVVVRQQSGAEDGEIVAALLSGEVTVRTYRRSGGRAWLMPHNPACTPLLGDEVSILGRVVAVLRGTCPACHRGQAGGYPPASARHGSGGQLAAVSLGPFGHPEQPGTAVAVKFERRGSGWPVGDVDVQA